MTNQELENLTFHYFTDQFCRRALTALFQAYDRTYKYCRANYAEPEATNLWPYERRAKFEGYLRDAAAMSPDLVATAVKAEKGNWYHTEIRGGPLMMTSSSVPTPGAMVDQSDFRLTLATNNDLKLFDDPDEPAPDTLYVLLLHSRSHRLGDEDPLATVNLPGSAYFGFPAPGLRNYLHRINLFDKYRETIRELTPKQWDEPTFLRYLGRARMVG